MDPIEQLLIRDYGVDPRTAKLMAKDPSFGGRLQMAGGVSPDAMAAALRDAQATGGVLPDNYQSAMRGYRATGQRQLGEIDAATANAMAASQNLTDITNREVAKVRGPQAQSLADAIAPNPTYNPGRDASGQGRAAYQDYTESVTQRGGGFDPSAVSRFAPGASSPTISGKPAAQADPELDTKINMYRQMLEKQYGPQRAEGLFKEKMLKQRALIQQQLGAIDAALGGNK